MSKVSVKIIKETAKAKLVESDCGLCGWVQNRSYNDGMVNIKTLEKAAESFQQRENDKQVMQDWNNAHHELTIERETDKAFCVAVEVCNMDLEIYNQKLVWFPKSLCPNNAAPGWFVRKKAIELLNNCKGYVGGTYHVTIAGENFYA